ncbi:hypothetical protein MLD38_030239 [Melastoma candidum]|uniref:Uncharacterized protein n=1 Tax=Melastoma candidum TaxID=119954 RepID=A0ACB9MMA0_9MYRT|nr:hypothetical protein MLD38_030239 [Melastoma candidum]
MASSKVRTGVGWRRLQGRGQCMGLAKSLLLSLALAYLARATCVPICPQTFKVKTLGKFKRDFDQRLSRGDGFSSAANKCLERAINRFDLDCLDAMAEQAKWDASKGRGKLMDDMRTVITSLQAKKLAKLTDTCKVPRKACNWGKFPALALEMTTLVSTSTFQANLCDGLGGPVEDLLENANDETWSSIRNLLRRETESVVSNFTSAIHGFDINERSKRDMLTELQDYATGVVEPKAREVARKVLILMKQRFSKSFFPDSSSMHRILTGKENFQAITHATICASLELLAAMAAVRLDNKDDNIKRELSVALLTNCSYSTSATGYNDITLGSLVSDKWEGIPPSRILITPVQCESLRRQLIQENKSVVNQTFSVQVKDWLKFKKAARKGAVPDFGTKISSMIRASLHRYEMETKNSDKIARMSKQMQLWENLLHLVRPSFQYVLGHMRCDTFYDFQEAFEKTLHSGKGFSLAAKDCSRHYTALFVESCKGAFIEQAARDSSAVSKELRRDMDDHVASVQDSKVRELMKACEGKLNDTLTGPVETLGWSKWRNLVLHKESSSLRD